VGGKKEKKDFVLPSPDWRVEIEIKKMGDGTPSRAGVLNSTGSNQSKDLKRALGKGNEDGIKWKKSLSNCARSQGR